MAVLRLTSPLKLSSTVAPVKLNEDAACPKEGQMCTIAGWGLDDEEDAGEGDCNGLAFRLVVNQL